ncbi:MAG: endolytic transglycosylase MltG [Rhodospirillaceae bacterium]|nr:endolytic transglycosylase MltG [Rhodospirillales bacterium]
MKSVFKLLFVLAVILIAVATWAVLEGHRRFTRPGPLAEATTVVIAKGAGLEAIARKLAAAGVVRDPYSFMAGAKLRQASLKAGEYAFPAHISPQDAVVMMGEGRTVVHKLTIAEGLTSKQILALVRDADYLTGDVAAVPPEGSLLPETWHLNRDDARDEVVARMEKSMRQLLDQLWPARAADLPVKTKEQALVLASIVERETGIKAERPMVAAVFVNRLRLGMRLQSDPTVIYGLSDGMGVLDHPITRADLETPHRWNTYVIDGLPPTPIANPGRASIEAVLHPADSPALYFVADGSGGHVFARSLTEHNNNVVNWRKVEKARREAK